MLSFCFIHNYIKCYIDTETKGRFCLNPFEMLAPFQCLTPDSRAHIYLRLTATDRAVRQLGLIDMPFGVVEASPKVKNHCVQFRVQAI